MSKTTGFVKEFRDFAVKGNAVDLAVGVIIGAAFGRIVDSLVRDIIMPLVNFILGGSVDFSNKFLVLSMPEGYAGPMTYADLTKAGANVFAWGNFVTIIINFVLLALVLCQRKGEKRHGRLAVAAFAGRFLRLATPVCGMLHVTLLFETTYFPAKNGYGLAPK